MRFVCLDTETTGLRPSEGHQIIEIGMVEIINNNLTDYTFQSYLSCNRKLDDMVKRVTNITDEILVGKPSFADIADKIIDFLETDGTGNANQGIIVAHNAKFDMSFLNHHFSQIGRDDMKRFKVVDTIHLIRNHIPGAKLTLDSLCERYNIDLAERQAMGHGALLDSKLLAKVLLKLIQDGADIDAILNEEKIIPIIQKQPNTIPIRMLYTISEQEITEHENMLKKIKSDTW